MNSGSTPISEMITANTSRGKPGQNKQADSPAFNPSMTAASNTKKEETYRYTVPSLAKQPGSSQIAHKKRTISEQLPIRATSNKQPVHPASDNPKVEETSKKIKNELQEHYLRSIILTPPVEDNAAVSDKDETEIKQFFGNDMHGEPPKSTS